ncbi:MAG: hypothetical protein ACTHOG_05530 [Marmoricola sp.]
MVATLAGCGQHPAAAACTALPASDVPPIAKALTQANTGSYCARPGTSVLITLKAATPDPGHAWALPQVTGPSGGSHWLSVPLTSVRGTTVAAIEVDSPGSYRLSSSASGRTWQATLEVR